MLLLRKVTSHPVMLKSKNLCYGTLRFSPRAQGSVPRSIWKTRSGIASEEFIKYLTLPVGPGAKTDLEEGVDVEVDVDVEVELWKKED